MSPDDDQYNQALSLDAYESIAFKGSSAQYLADSIRDITALSQQGDLYPPSFATFRETEIEGISLRPHDQREGRVSPAEAVACKALADEGSAMAQSFGRGKGESILFEEIAGFPNAWPTDIFEGMGDFGNSLHGAIRARELIQSGISIPTGKTNGEELDRRLWELYQSSLQRDGMIIGKNTVEAVSKDANGFVEQRIRGIPEGAQKEEELQNRMKSRRRGIELGEKIYQETLDVAIQRGVPTRLDSAITVKTSLSPHKLLESFAKKK